MARRKMKNSAVLLSTLFVTGTIMIAGTSSVFAGFEWKSYTPKPAPAAPENNLPETPALKVPAVEVPAVEKEKLSAEKAPAPSVSAESDVLSGFGSELPLVIALQQVVPAGYQFSFATGVNPGAAVSWEGGKPWKQVLANMLSAQKLGFHLNDNIIAIGPFAGEEPPVRRPVAAVAVKEPAAAVVVAPPAALPKTEALADDTFLAIDETEPVIVRRSGRRGSVATRREIAAGHRDWIDRFKDKFRKKDKVKTETQDKSLAKNDIQWNNGAAETVIQKAPAQKESAVASAPPAPANDIQWNKDVAEKPIQIAPFVESAALPAEKKPELAPVALAPSPAMPAESEVVSGFGSGLPLTIALDQIVPENYQYSLASGVKKDIIVSWEGGKPWKQVLTDMLSAQKLGFQLQNNALTVDYLAAEKQQPPQAIAAVTVKEPVLPSPPPPAAAAKPDAAPVNALPDNEKTKPVMLRRDSGAGRRDSADAVRSGSAAEHPGWMERLKSRFTKRDQTKNAPAVKAAEIPPAAEVAPSPVAVPLIATMKYADEKPAPAPMAQPSVIKPTWLATKDMTLKGALTKWSKTADVELYWPIDYDYRLKDDVAYGGTFEEAVGKLLDNFTKIRPQPYGELHHVADGSSVLIINTYDLYN